MTTHENTACCYCTNKNHNPYYIDYLQTETQDMENYIWRKQVKKPTYNSSGGYIRGSYEPTTHNIKNTIRVGVLMNDYKTTINTIIPELIANVRTTRRNKTINVVNNENLLVFQMYSQQCIEIIHKYLQIQDEDYNYQVDLQKRHENLMETFDGIKDYVKDCLKKISVKYNCEPHSFYTENTNDST
jgi:hypothetical protein